MNMKFNLLAILCLLSLSVLAQKAEPIPGYSRVQYPVQWYKDQAAAWKKLVDKNDKDATAWYNYYKANRMLVFHDTADKRSEEEKYKTIIRIIDDMGNAIPNTYEYNLSKYMAGGGDNKLWPYLKKAAELGAGRTEHYDYMINWGETTQDISIRDEYSKKKYEAGQVSAGMMYYNYNVMMGAEPNAILIAVGDNDTYPVWVLQSMGIRRDIHLINLSLILIDDYRTKLFKELGIEPWDMHWDAPAAEEEERRRFEKNFIKNITENKKHFPVYITLTAAGYKEGLKSIEDNLYLTGLAYKYSKAPMDNMAVMKKNFEQLYALDYISKPFYKDISAELVKLINTNYIVPMLKLYDHYKTSGDVQRQEWIREKLLDISKDSESEQDVKEHLARK